MAIGNLWQSDQKLIQFFGFDQKRLCSGKKEWRGCNRVYWLARVVAIGDLWQSDQNLIQFFGFDQKRLCSKRE